MNNLVSVIIPCFNQANYLSDALQSVLDQTHNNWECFIVNDGSLDDTEDVALKWCQKDGRFKYLKKENGGLSSARNAGLKAVTGYYIQFLDADDAIDKNKFQIQISKLSNASNYAISYCDYFTSTEKNLSDSFPSRYITPKFKTNNCLNELITNWEVKLSIPCHCFLFKSNVFKENSIYFDESLQNHEDWDCWMNIFSLNPELYYIDKKLATYRIQQNSLCHDLKSMKQGFSHAIDKQKNKLKHNKQANNLLTIKYNLVMFGVNTSNTYYAILMRYLKFLYRIIRNLFFRNDDENISKKTITR